MDQKIKVGLATIIGLALGISSLLAAIATGIAGTQVAGLPPSWQAGIGVASLWITKGGRYLQAFAAAGETFFPAFDEPGPVKIPPVGFQPDPATVAALDAAPTHPGEAVAP